MGYYAIYAYENMYGGLHGINDYAVVEADSYEMAEKFAAELSGEVIEDYVADELVEIAKDEGMDEDEFEEFYRQNMAYDIYTLDESKILKANLSLPSLSDEFWNTPHEFIEKYKVEGEDEFYDSLF